ncbi:hypothetical protein KY348_00650 [Candidatus Woesearchaeota archaeon]|nr:hypothetical protein [Candidatus Woesearchaeota archaeon]
MRPTFVVIDGFEKSPDRIDAPYGIEVKGVETPDRVELKELPLGTVVQFYGLHPDSKYICLIAGTEEHKQIKVWLKGRGNGAVGDLEAITSVDYRAPREKAVEEGVMEIRKNYFMPTFEYDENDNLTLRGGGANSRFEPYTKIFVLKPSD